MQYFYLLSLLLSIQEKMCRFLSDSRSSFTTDFQPLSTTRQSLGISLAIHICFVYVHSYNVTSDELTHTHRHRACTQTSSATVVCLSRRRGSPKRVRSCLSAGSRVCACVRVTRPSDGSATSARQQSSPYTSQAADRYVSRRRLMHHSQLLSAPFDEPLADS